MATTTATTTKERVALTETGQGYPLLLLRTGGGAKLAETLARQFRVLRCERDASADALVAELQTRGIDRLGVIAHGAAAAVALSLAQTLGEKVEAVALMAPPEAETLGNVAQLKTPVFAVFGSKDRNSPPSRGTSYRAALPNCHLMLIYDAGADMDAERPDAVAAALAEFMTAREKFLVTHKSGKIYE
jgi:pimeloyl-ACP methyl ester carboxylesterase